MNKLFLRYMPLNLSKRRAISYCICALGIGGVSGLLVCFIPSGQAARFGSYPAVKVVVSEASKQLVSDEIIYPVRIIPEKEVYIHSEVSGLISEQTVRFGDEVSQGQTLFKIRNADPLQEFRAFSVKSPIKGHLQKVLVHVGSHVQAGEVIAHVVSKEASKIVAHFVPEDISKLPLGTDGEFRSGAHTLAVKVKAISPVLDPRTGTAVAELNFTDSGPIPMLIGSLGRALFKTNLRHSILVNENAIFYRNQEPHIIRVTEASKAHFVPVRIISTRNGSVELEGSLPESALIVTHSVGGIEPNQALDIMKDEDQ